MINVSLISRIHGCIAALAVGDAYGIIGQFSMAANKAMWGNMPQDLTKPKESPEDPTVHAGMERGEITDDTAMGLMILEPYLNRGYLDMSEVGKNFAEEIRQVDSGEKPNIGYPKRSSFDMRKLGLGCNWRFSGHNSTGCGAAMRVFGVPLTTNDENQLRENVFNSAKTTHDSDNGRGSALAIAEAIRIILAEEIKLENMSDKKEFLNKIVEKIKEIFPELATKIHSIENLLNKTTKEALEKLGTNGDAIETVPTAIYCFLKTPDDFKTTLRSSINVDGDSDSIGCIACSISGAYNGVEKIPKHLIENLKSKSEIERIIEKFN